MSHAFWMMYVCMYCLFCMYVTLVGDCFFSQVGIIRFELEFITSSSSFFSYLCSFKSVFAFAFLQRSWMDLILSCSFTLYPPASSCYNGLIAGFLRRF